MVRNVYSRLTQAIVAATVALVAAACGRSSAPAGLDAALSEAGVNSRELARALSHYDAATDSLQSAAMRFLVGNMAGKGTVGGPRVDEFCAFIDSVYAIRQPEYDIPAIYARFRSGARHLDDPLEPRRDAATLAAGYLIENVDEAMKWWQRPWNVHLSFDEFCEYVLPYRVGSEEVQPWRETYAARFAQLVPDTATALQAATAINDSLRRLPAHIALSGLLPITLRPSTLLNMKFGVCSDYAALAAYAMRAAGIPVTINFIPHWGRKNGAHTFNAVLDNDGRWHDFSGAEDAPDDHLRRFTGGIPKIYRLGFGSSPDALASQCGGEAIPPLFRNAALADVTADFTAVNSVNVTVDAPARCRNRFAYLCVFTPQGWEPVAWGSVEDGKAHFVSVGSGIVYQPALYSSDGLQPFGDAFFLGDDGAARPIAARDERCEVMLCRKNPVSENLRAYPASIVGGRFEAADNPQFRDAVTLHQIIDTPDFRFTTVRLPAANTFRYLRYVSSDSTYGNMAEVAFLGNDGRRLQGRVIGDYSPSIYYPRNGAEMLFDDDPLTFFHTSDLGSWGGLELPAPAKVSAIRFLIRNDDNGIRRGHEYELFYASDGKWLSAGRQIAPADDEIKFAEVPAGALLWLHDHTGGREERIFEVSDNNKIIWH